MSETRTGFWSGQTLASNTSVITPFEIDGVDANAYNLRMGDSYFRTGDTHGKEEQKKTPLAPGEAFLIPPGQFAFLTTRETIKVPHDAMAFISMRTGLKFQGLINVSGFHVDPGYEGRLIYSVFNASPSPIQICEGDRVFKIWFAHLDQVSDPDHLFKGSPQKGITNELVRGMSKENVSLQGLADRIAVLEKDVASQKPSIEILSIVWRTLIVGVVGAAILALLLFLWTKVSPAPAPVPPAPPSNSSVVPFP